jgi:hypothetical protein
MAQFISMKKQQLIAMASAGQIVAGNLYFSNDTQELFLAVTGTPNAALFPMSSLILTGEYELAGNQGPAGADGAQGPAGPHGPAGPGISLAQAIATSIALG